MQNPYRILDFETCKCTVYGLRYSFVFPAAIGNSFFYVNVTIKYIYRYILSKENVILVIDF